jgi:hypothetical protein
MTAANLLGFTTQNPKQPEIATNGTSLPRLIVGHEVKIHTRRPESWRDLSQVDGAILEFLRQRGMSSELSEEGTIEKLIGLFKEGDRFDRLCAVAATEPPRVRAMLGAIGQQMNKPKKAFAALQTSLNPLSRFDFGILIGLRYARDWQAKERATREAI